jgi:hypothetical protein
MFLRRAPEFGMQAPASPPRVGQRDWAEYERTPGKG